MESKQKCSNDKSSVLRSIDGARDCVKLEKKKKQLCLCLT